MIRCLLFGHRPHPTFEFQRLDLRRLTYCERCGQGFTHVVSSDYPLPEGAKSRREYNEELAHLVVMGLRGRLVRETDQFTDEIDIVIREALEEHGFPKKPRARATPVNKRQKRSER
jgi:hypothetical protein